MNRSYMYANGNIHIFDEKYNKKVIEYNDNFLKQLVIENNIESIESLIYDNDNIIEELEREIKEIKTNIFEDSLFIITASNLINYILSNCFEINKKDLITLFLFSISICLNNIFIKIKNIKNINKELIARIKLREGLVIKYNSDKSSLISLNNNKTKNNQLYYEETAKFIEFSVDDTSSSLKLQSFVNATLYYELNKKDLIRKYSKGLLEEELLNLLPSEMNLILKFIEEEWENEMVINNLKKIKRR